MARQYGIEVPTFGLDPCGQSVRPHGSAHEATFSIACAADAFLLLILLAVMLLWSSTTSYSLETLNLGSTVRAGSLHRVLDPAGRVSGRSWRARHSSAPSHWSCSGATRRFKAA
jgi:hypothetical protein